MNRDTAVSTWRDVCGSDTVMAMGFATGRMLEEFARRIEAAECERCAKVAEDYLNGTPEGCDIARLIRGA